MVGHTRTRARALVIISTCVLALVLLLATTVSAGSDSVSAGSVEFGVEEYRVEAGDTLWEIAAERTSRGGDVRSTVGRITDLSDLTSSLIRPGQLLVVPELG